MDKGIMILVVYAAVMLLATLLFTRKEHDFEKFCVSSRNENWILSALSIAATWIWAPSLFVSAEKAYTTGIIGLFWFLVPNVLCLIIFIPFAQKIRKEMPGGMTLSGYMKKKYDSNGVKRIYLFQLLGLSCLSTGVQLLAGSQIVSIITGLPFWAVTVILAAIAFSYSQFSGIRASILTDALQMVFMLAACAAFLFLGLGRGHGTLLNGMGGIGGNDTSLFCPEGIEVFLSFGLPTAVGLLSGPFGDQSFWQRAFAVQRRNLGKAFFLGALLFGAVPLTMGLLGLTGAGAGYQAENLGVINFELISFLLPGWAVIPFLFMIISGLLSTIDSNLCAVSSLTADLFRENSLKKTKCAMVLLLAAGILTANVPGMTVTHLFLFYGTLRSSTLLPTILTLMGVKLRADGVIGGVIAALAAGLPIFACGTIWDSGIYKTIGSLTTVLLAGILAVVVSRWEVRREKRIGQKTVYEK